MPLVLHSSNRLEALATMLAALLRKGGAGMEDPFEPLRIVVQTPGVARWLSLRLADELGCCMNVRYVFPGNFIDECLEVALGKEEARPERQRLMWRIFAHLPALARSGGSGTLARYLGENAAHRRLQLARRVADLFDQYLIYRPDLLARWEIGADVGDWQALLWRDLCAEEPTAHIAARLKRYEATLQAGAKVPGRVFLFGLSTLPPAHVEFFRLLGQRGQVDLFLMAPSEQYWGDLPGRWQAARERAFASDGDLPAFGQPLLSSLGAQGRDFLNLLVDADAEPGMEIFPEPEENTVLERLQGDFLLMNPAHEPLEEEPDSSLRVAACAGTIRELEALKDQILSAFDEDPTLAPRDILVLVPDIAAFAPGVRAVFGTAAVGEPKLPFHVADRTPRDNPLFAALLALMELVDTRHTVTELIALLEQPAIGERFSLSAEDLVELRGMCAERGVCWGLDAGEREALGFGPEGANSWLAGVDSFVLGVLMDGRDDSVFCNVAPYEEGEGERVGLIARITAAFDALRQSLHSLQTPRPLSQWPDALQAIVQQILPKNDANILEHSALNRVLERLRELASLAGEDSLDVHSLLEVLEGMLSDSIAPHGFLSGGITFAELKPMRSVPARMVCLLGMDDEAFPRQNRPLSFDHMAQTPRPGDRSTREGDRYLFLETLLCARERLYISYSGISPYGEADKPPAVPVSELLQYLAGENASHFILRHPLQPFSPAYFNESGPLFSYSRGNMEAARAAQAQEAPPSFCPEPIEHVGEDSLWLDLNTLCEFLSHPSRYFLTHVMGLVSPFEEAPLAEEEPLELDGLSSYMQRGRILQAHLQGRDSEQCHHRVRAEGALPWGAAGAEALRGVDKDAARLYAAISEEAKGEPESFHGVLEFPSLEPGEGTLHLSLNLGPVYGSRLVEYRAGGLRVNEHLRGWVLALVAGALLEAGEERLCGLEQICQIGRDSSLYTNLPDHARERLEKLIALYREGLSRPLPIFPKSSFAYAALRHGPRTKLSPYERALRAWTSSPYGSDAASESEDPWICIAFGGQDPLRTNPDSFAQYAERLWQDCADYQEVISR